jgi:phosphatidylglycerol:prolipoprotein diacylglycerol transferase
VLPVLFHVGAFAVPTYGVMLGLGLLVGMGIGALRAARDGMPADWAWDLGLLTIVVAIVGARLEHVRTHPAVFLEHPEKVFALRDGGMVFYGGFALTLVAFAVYARFRGRSFLALTDMMAPSVGFGHAVGRLGCLGAGCCFGQPTDSAWRLVFPEGRIAPAGVPLVPVQVHEVLANLAIGVLLWVLPRRFVGQRTALLFFLYGTFRFVNEFFRADNRGTVLGTWVTNGQATSVVMLVAAAGIVAWGRRSGMRGAG